ncbi:MAG: hypothetical protein R3E65_12295 [Steroidobacteraceae bacterium]
MTPTASARTGQRDPDLREQDVIGDCGHIMMSERPEQTHRLLVQALS